MRALITALLARFAAADVHPGGVLAALAHLRPDFAVLVAVLAFACNTEHRNRNLMPETCVMSRQRARCVSNRALLRHCSRHVLVITSYRHSLLMNGAKRTEKCDQSASSDI